MKLKKNANRTGFTLVELMIVVGIIGLVAAIAVPHFIRARAQSRKNSCIANLRQINNAKTTWGAETGKQPTDTPIDADLFGADKYLREKPLCPSEGDYTLAPLDTPPTCSLGPLEGHVL
jgi:type IV pilus assembly protein PilA